MNFELIIYIEKALFAAVAAFGFASISNPPKRALTASAFLAAVGVSFRYYLTSQLMLPLPSATFLAAILMGSISFLTAHIIRIPNEVFTFPSLLPMIPGMFAYKSILYMMRFLRITDSDANIDNLFESFRYGFTSLFIMVALVVGISVPVMLFNRQSFTVTRKWRFFRKQRS